VHILRLNIRRIELLWVLVLILILNGASYIPIWQNIQNAPANRYYWGGMTEFPIDATGNLATIREGYDGSWSRFAWETTTIRSSIPSALKFEYILIGQIGRLLHIEPLTMYHLSKFVISTVLLLFIWLLLCTVFQTTFERLTGFIFSLFATSVIISNGSDASFLTYVPSETYVFSRLTIVAHHYLLGALFSLMSLYLLSRALDKNNIKYLLCAGAIGILGGLAFAPSMVLALLALPIFLLIRLLKRPSKTSFMRDCLLTGSFAGLTGLSLLYLQYMTQFWDYNTLTTTEQIVNFSIQPINYVAMVGIPYILSIIAIPYVLKKSNTFLLLILPWVIVHPIAVFLISPIFKINLLRFFLSTYFIVFSILAVSGISFLIIVLKRWIRTKYLPLLVFGVITIITLASGYGAYIVSWNALKVQYNMPESWTYGYPKREFMEGVWWLRDHTTDKDIVLSDPYSGTLITPFSGNPVFTSWWFRLVSPSLFYSYYQPLSAFYNGIMTDAEARNFLQSNTISYVMVRFDDVDFPSPPRGLPYPLLTQVYANPTVIIYKVSP